MSVWQDKTGLVSQRGPAIAAPVAMRLDGGQTLQMDFGGLQPWTGRFFPDVGLITWLGEPWRVFYLVGASAMGGAPGQTSAELLSVVCAYRGRNLFVHPRIDAGSSLCRQPAADMRNNVLIDGAPFVTDALVTTDNPSADRALFDVQWTVRYLQASCSTGVYSDRARLPVHHRSIQVEAFGGLEVVDWIEGAGVSHTLCGGMLLDAAWRVVEQCADGWLIADGISALKMNVTAQTHATLSCHRVPDGDGMKSWRLSWETRGQLPQRIVTTVIPVE